MAPTEDELKSADLDAVWVINAWGDLLPGHTDVDLENLAVKANCYQQARDQAGFYRQRSKLIETEEGMEALAKERNAWQVFIEPLKVYAEARNMWRPSYKG